MEIFDVLDSLYPEIVSWRRYLHRHPELSYQESKTSAFVADKLREWGIEVQTGIGGSHGVIGRLRGNEAGPTVALRADMDALPIQDEKACEYASTVQGVMHACGHDGHTSTLLGVAKALSHCRDALKGTVVFIFQPAEETTPGGALNLIEAGALEGVDVIYGTHLWTPFEIGTAYCKPGPIMAAADEFIIDITGKGGHGGLPHVTIDTVFIASQLVVNLQSIVSRSTDPTEPCVVSVGSIHSGTTFNVIAETASLKGTVRTFNNEVRMQAKERLETIVDQTCRMYGADYMLDYKLGYPPVVNHEEEVNRFFRAAPQHFNTSGVKTSPLIMAAEDFAYYLEHVPGCFFFVGAGNSEKGITAPHHHPRFDIDERAMLNAAKLFVSLTLDYMADHQAAVK